MTQATITHKAGDTFRRSLTRTDDGGNPVDLSGVPVDAVFVRGPAKIIISGTVTNAAAGAVELTASAATTADWLPGLYQGDITFGTELTTSASTQTFSLVVERGYNAG